MYSWEQQPFEPTREHWREKARAALKAALSAQPAEHPAAPVGVPDAPLSVFSKGGWTYSGTGQSFDEKAMDEAAFVAYRDYFAAAPSAPQGVE
jgi:hypothetical protein